MRSTYVQVAVVDIAQGGDHEAPGGRVTVELCGHWEHDGACRWPHHTAVEVLAPDQFAVRTVFAATAEDEPSVRAQIVAALMAGRGDGPSGETRWVVVSESRGEPTVVEHDFAARQEPAG